jgi:KUP system potassium uptake protein
MNDTAAGPNPDASPVEPSAMAESHGHAHGPLYKLMVGAIGIVFGDIGTSPIYAFRETFAGHHTLEPNALHIYGVLSLIFWSMLTIVAVKYVFVIMRADNKGEGGSLALLALISRSVGSDTRKWTAGIVMLGVFATALFYGDSMITPAISVLSAVEGLTTVEARFEPFVIPIAITILVGLFAIQSRGTAKVGALFGPIMLIYFVTLSILGAIHIVDHPAVLYQMLNPWNAMAFFLS